MLSWLTYSLLFGSAIVTPRLLAATIYIDNVTTPINGSFTLYPGDMIHSFSDTTYLNFQENNYNFVLYVNGDEALWDSKTGWFQCKCEIIEMIINSDGNIFAITEEATVWESDTAGNIATQPHTLRVTDNCAYLFNKESILWNVGLCDAVLNLFQTTVPPTITSTTEQSVSMATTISTTEQAASTTEQSIPVSTTEQTVSTTKQSVSSYISTILTSLSPITMMPESTSPISSTMRTTTTITQTQIYSTGNGENTENTDSGNENETNLTDYDDNFAWIKSILISATVCIAIVVITACLCIGKRKQLENDVQMIGTGVMQLNIQESHMAPKDDTNENSTEKITDKGNGRPWESVKTYAETAGNIAPDEFIVGDNDNEHHTATKQ